MFINDVARCNSAYTNYYGMSELLSTTADGHRPWRPWQCIKNRGKVTVALTRSHKRWRKYLHYGSILFFLFRYRLIVHVLHYDYHFLRKNNILQFLACSSWTLWYVLLPLLYIVNKCYHFSIWLQYLYFCNCHFLS